jgi:hypothetical protein
VGNEFVYIPTWTASLELMTVTKYPSARQIFSGTVPWMIMEEFDEKITPILENSVIDRFRPILFAKSIRQRYEHYEQKQDKENASWKVHPVALRAAWKSSGKKPTTPIYDYAQVISMVPQKDPVPARCIEIVHTDHSLCVDGYVVGDSIK